VFEYWCGACMLSELEEELEVWNLWSSLIGVARCGIA
jgi:hypothetical protein